jgi:hypothetical protein
MVRKIQARPVSYIFETGTGKGIWKRYLLVTLAYVILLLILIATTARAEETMPKIPCEVWAGKRIFGIISVSKSVIFDMPAADTTADGIWLQLMSNDQKTKDAIQNAILSLQKDIPNPKAKGFDRGGLRCRASDGTLEVTITLHRKYE